MISFPNLIDALAAAPEDRPFVTFWVDQDEQETVSFGQFRQRARLHAQVLQANGLQRGDRVVLIMPQGILAMTAFVGAMIMGSVPAFLAYPNFKVDPAKYRFGLAGVTANLGASIVAIDHDFPEEMLGHVSLGTNAKLVRLTDPAGDANIADVGRCKIDGQSLAFIQHSAGTTGLQKGVALSHAAVLRQVEHLSKALKVNGATDRIYSWLPLYHDMGLIACFVLPLVCHVHVVMQSPLDWVMHPDTMLQVIEEHRCTLAWLPNFAFQFVPRRTPRSRGTEHDLSSVRALINCSEPVRASSMNEFQSAFEAVGLARNALQSSYAMAENVFAITQSDIDLPCGPPRIWTDASQFRMSGIAAPVAENTPGALCFVSSGKLLPNTEIQIVSDSGELLPDRRVGEIFVRSDCLFDGYFHRPDLTAQALEGGWYRTGDLGFRLEDDLYVIGRKKDLLIVAGENLYPHDIEEVVAGHPAIHDGRVIATGVYNPELGTEDIVVVAELEHEHLLSRAAEIESEVRSRVVAAMGVALRTVFLKPPKWIVKSTAGKAARSATREKLLREHPELSVEG